MKNTIILILISLLVINCEDGGSGSGDLPPGAAINKSAGDYIPNNQAELGQIANHILDNDQNFNDFFYKTLENGDKMYGDSQIVFAIRGYVNAKAKAVDVQGEMNVLAETPMDAFMEAVYVADGSSRGVSQMGLCYLTADIYNSFRIDSSVVVVSGVSHSLAENNTYCAVEIHLPSGDILIDPLLNRSFYHNHISWMSSLELLEANNNGQILEIKTNPDGMINAMPGWSPLNNYYHTFDDLDSNQTQRELAVAELYELVFDSVNYVDYEDLR